MPIRVFDEYGRSISVGTSVYPTGSPSDIGRVSHVSDPDVDSHPKIWVDFPDGTSEHYTTSWDGGQDFTADELTAVASS